MNVIGVIHNDLPTDENKDKMEMRIFTKDPISDRIYCFVYENYFEYKDNKKIEHYSFKRIHTYNPQAGELQNCSNPPSGYEEIAKTLPSHPKVRLFIIFKDDKEPDLT